MIRRSARTNRVQGRLSNHRTVAAIVIPVLSMVTGTHLPRAFAGEAGGAAEAGLVVWVSATLGDDQNDGLSQTAPKRTISGTGGALSVIAASPDKTGTVRVRGGSGESYTTGDDALRITTGGLHVTVEPWPDLPRPTLAPPATESVIVIGAPGVELACRQIDLTCSRPGVGIHLTSAATDVRLDLTDCAYRKTAGYAYSGSVLYAEPAPGAVREIRLTDSTIEYAPATADAGYPFYVWDARSVVLERTRITAAAAFSGPAFLRLRGVISDLVAVAECRISLPGAFLDAASYGPTGNVGGYTSLVVARDNEFDGGNSFASLSRFVRRATVRGNVIRLTDTDKPGILCGFDWTTPSDTFDVGGVEVIGNTVSFAGPRYGHGIELGMGVDAGVCAFNTVTDGWWGIVIKASHCAIHHNTVVMRTTNTPAIGIYAGAGNDCHQNTIYATGTTSAIEIADQPGVGYAVGTKVRRNIIAAVGGGGCIGIKDAATAGTHRIDENAYWRGSGAGALVRVGGTAYGSLDAVRAMWRGAGGWAENDGRSFEADPRFVDPAASDFALQLGSPCAGTAGTRWENLGAWQYRPVASGDLDGDGDVDLADFATFQACFNGPNRPPACVSSGPRYGDIIHYEPMDDITGWSPTRCTLSYDTVHYVAGGNHPRAILLTKTDGTDAKILRDYGTATKDLSGACLRARFFIPTVEDAAMLSDGGASILLNVGDAAGRFAVGYLKSYARAQSGWTTVARPLASLAGAGTVNLAAIRYVQWQILTQAGRNPTIVLGSAEFYVGRSRGVYCLTLDDGPDSQYPMLTYAGERGVRASVFVNPANVGRPGFMTIEQLRTLHAAGHLIANHGYAHVYPSAGKDAVLNDVAAGAQWLDASGFGDGSRIYSLPGGAGTWYRDEIGWDYRTEVLGPYCDAVRNTGSCSSSQDTIDIRDIATNCFDSVTDANSRLDDAINHKGVVVVGVHKIPDLAAWQAHIDRVAAAVAAGTVEVRTLADLWTR